MERIGGNTVAQISRSNPDGAAVSAPRSALLSALERRESAVMGVLDGAPLLPLSRYCVFVRHARVHEALAGSPLSVVSSFLVPLFFAVSPPSLSLDPPPRCSPRDGRECTGSFSSPLLSTTRSLSLFLSHAFFSSESISLLRWSSQRNFIEAAPLFVAH